MDLLPVESSNLAKVGYSPEHRILMVEFKKTGAHWQYHDVPPEIHHALMKANETEGDSVGKFFCREIKNVYPGRQVMPEVERQ